MLCLMKLIALPDLHDSGTKCLQLIAPQLAEADYILLVGDLTNSGREVSVQRVIDEVKYFNPCILAVHGNWDLREAGDHLIQLGIGLHRRHQIIDGVAFVGVGGALTHYGIVGTRYSEYTESEFETFLEDAHRGIPADIPTILVSHEPPYNTLNDLTSSKKHVGSKAVREYIERTRPMLCLCGHIHEGVGIDTIGKTQILNPGPLWEGGYGIIEVDANGVYRLEIGQIPHPRRK
jgi:uncharacterized protein